jgi:DNA-binding GntR family transcriptional regulator
MVQHSLGPTSQAGKPMTSAEEAVNELRRRILSGSLAAGTKLHQEHLASSLGMSRIPIRDAIRTLVAEGLVLQFPRRTAVVAPISADDLTELYEIRIAIEPEASALAVPNVRPADLMSMRALLQVMDTTHEHPVWLDTNDEFHRALYRRSGRPRMVVLLDQARAQTRRYTAVRLDSGQPGLHAEHQLILAAVERRDPAAVRALVQAHLVSAYSILRHQIESLDQAANPSPDSYPYRVEGGSTATF